MTDHDFDEGTTHNHDWAAANTSCAAERALHPLVADAAAVPTPSSVLHDDLMEISR